MKLFTHLFIHIYHVSLIALFADPNEAKWSYAREFRYKIATTFMPAYAKAIYEYFDAKVVLDPCAGWLVDVLFL